MKKISYHPDGERIIEFEPRWHSYIDNYDKRYKSVTKFISQFFEKFDSEKISENCSKNKNSEYYGIDPKKIRKQWELKAEAAQEKGTKVHEYSEYLISNGLQGSNLHPKNEEEKKIFGTTQKIVKILLKKYKFIAAEMIVFCPDLKISGMIDLIMYDPKKNKILIIDWKTNQKISRDNIYKNALNPIPNITDDSYSKYSLQLSTYRFILEKNNYFEKKEYGQAIIHLKPNEFSVIPIPYLKPEIEKMIKWKQK